VRATVLIGIASRAFVVIVAILSAFLFDAGGSGNRAAFDVAPLTHPFASRVLDDAFSPLARWDAVWYLDIARDGYGGDGLLPGNLKPAFFPLYPLLVRAAAGFSKSPGALLIAAYAVSTAAFIAALYLLSRLVELEVGRRFARPAVLLTALFPAALFFGAPYSESVFLMLSIAAFYLARREHWGLAAAAIALASATRVTGVVLILPVAIFYFYGPREIEPDYPVRGWRPRYRLRPDVAWLSLAPLGLLLYSAHLGAQGDALGYLRLQDVWDRQLTIPLIGAARGLGAALDGVGLFLDKLQGHPLSKPLRAGWSDVVNFAFLAFALVATAGVFKRLPLAYGVYCLAALLLPLSSPRTSEPLYSFPRFAAVLFPMFIWLAMVAEKRKLTMPLAVASGLLLGFFTQQFATWEFFA
jgi:hypothetical protein